MDIPRTGDRYPIWFDAADHESFAYATIANEEGRAQIRQLFGEDPIEQIRKLDELRVAGIITDAEFQQKKSDLLAQL